MTTLFLVDDHAIVREGLRALLEGAGHRVLGEAGDPAAALDGIAALQPDLVLLDMGLGERSGLELLDSLAARRLPARVLMLTMSAHPRHVAEALRRGAMGYVLKGSPAKDLLAAIDAVAAGRRHFGPEVADLVVQGLDAAAGGADPLALLSPRERQILLLVVGGASSASIGERLHLSPKTVDTYRSRLMAKLGVADVASLVRLAVRTGLIDANPG